MYQKGARQFGAKYKSSALKKLDSEDSRTEKIHLRSNSFDTHGAPNDNQLIYSPFGSGDQISPIL